MKNISLSFIVVAFVLVSACESNRTKTDKNENKTNNNEMNLENAEKDYVLLCPYCISEITEETAICEQCNQDTRNDAVIEETLADFKNMETKSCNNCQKSIPHLANTCKYCKKKTK